MKIVYCLTPYGILKGLYNVKAGLVSFTCAGVVYYVSADQIVSSLLLNQAF